PDNDLQHPTASCTSVKGAAAVGILEGESVHGPTPFQAEREFSESELGLPCKVREGLSFIELVIHSGRDLDLGGDDQRVDAIRQQAWWSLQAPSRPTSGFWR